MRRTRSVLSALVVALMLVVSVDYLSFAATGQSMILGRINKANGVTTLTRTTAGPALQLNVASGPPLKVNSSKRVAKLNADMVDGKNARDFATSDAPPLARGYILSDGTVSGGRGIDSVSWSAPTNRYEITLTGVSYFYTDFVTVVTPLCPGYTAAVSSSEPLLLVYIRDASNTGAQCSFAFVTYGL